MSTVLIVDDSSTVREMVSSILKKSGLAIIEAADGLEAKQKIQATSPDLVVTDIVMPKMNGYELCRWIKNDPEAPDPKIPVVMCTSKSEEFDRYWGMKQGADAYIAKPFIPAELVKTIKQLLRG
ncbi:MAG: response regulator [Oscillatoria sp. SIO1A7]|nr:response regulator [Oscillatoria sp. SIO1A7]